LKTEDHRLLAQLPCPTNYGGGPNFTLRLRLNHLEVFGSGSNHPKLLGRRLHSPGCYSHFTLKSAMGPYLNHTPC